MRGQKNQKASVSPPSKDGESKKRVRINDPLMKSHDGDSANKVTKVPTEGSAQYFSGAVTAKKDESPNRLKIIDPSRLKSLGLDRLSQKIGLKI